MMPIFVLTFDFELLLLDEFSKNPAKYKRQMELYHAALKELFPPEAARTAVGTAGAPAQWPAASATDRSHTKT